MICCHTKSFKKRDNVKTRTADEEREKERETDRERARDKRVITTGHMRQFEEFIQE